MTRLAPGTLCLIVGVTWPPHVGANGRFCTIVGPDTRGGFAESYEIEADWLPEGWPRYAERRILRPILPPEGAEVFLADIPTLDREAA